jgi:Flp pilus assembly protein TadB
MDMLLNILLMVGGAGTVFFFARSFFGMMFSMDNHRQHQKRMRQLKFTEEGRKPDDSTAEMIDTVTRPIIKFILPKLQMRDKEKLRKDLKIAGWEKTFTPDQYIAMDIILKIVGVVLGALFFNLSWQLALVWFTIAFFGFGFFFNNSIKEKKKKIFNEFPNFIRIIQGYLTAGIPLSKAVEEALPYMSPEWKVMMKDFVINTNLLSVQDAIGRLNDEVDIFEIQEFFSLVRLNIEQGINVKESFDGQREKVVDMQFESMMAKIGQRQMMATLLQGPLLLTMILSFGLPVIYSMVNFTSL